MPSWSRWTLLLLLLSGCAAPEPPRPTPAVASPGITQATLERMVAETTRPQRDGSGNDQVIASCAFNEGVRCTYLPGAVVDTYDFREDPETHTLEHRLDPALGAQILAEPGPKHVDQAQNNTVLIECHRAEAGTTCQINGGAGWEPLAIR